MRARVTAALIVLALLAQALAVVRHSTMVVSHAIAVSISSVASDVSADLARDLAASICHPGGSGSGKAALPDEPTRPDDPSAKCPLCNGLAAATLLPPPNSVAVEVLALSQTIEFPAFDERIVAHGLIRPKSRGPPAAVASFPA